MSVITSQDRERFSEQGYLVVPGVVNAELCRRVIEAICEFVGADLQDPSTWYRRPNHGHGIVPLHHEPRLWQVRELPSIYDAFRQLYDCEDLWVTMDRVSFKPPPRKGDAPFRPSPLHWDCDPRNFHRLGIQGLVYLTDTAEDRGAFACVPELFRDLQAWLADHAEDDDIRHPDIGERELVSVGGPAGSLVLWHRLMPHTSTRNDSTDPRFVQYVAMRPAGDETERAMRLRDFRERSAPAWALRQHVHGHINPEPWKPIELSALGRKLVGLDQW
ncbi:MAG: phytanoyl-CoA dioxygenase family protein [Myxococcota bacterium]